MRASLILFMLLAPSLAMAAEQAMVSGLVRDADTGAGLSGLTVEVYKSGEYDKPVSKSTTDEGGRYEVAVESGFYYDAYLRYGGSNPTMRTPEAARGGRTYELNFNIKESSNFTEVVVGKYGIWVVVAVALIVLALIVIDIMSSRRKSGSSPADFRKERDEIQKMLDISHEKYLKREIDEETFKSITSAKQERLIELESKLKEHGG